MEKNRIHKIITGYFGRRFSVRSRWLFGRWLRSEEDSVEKEQVLRELWEAVPLRSQVDVPGPWRSLPQTFQREVHRSPVRYVPRWAGYAAAVLLLLLTGTTAYYLGKPSAPQVQLAELFVPYGQSKEVRLPDGSEVRLSSGSLLVYPTDFTSLGQRNIYLAGKAYFTVTKDKAKPFVVRTGSLEVEVLGTVFGVEAYPTDTISSASLLEGSVKAGVHGMEGQPHILRPNERFIFNKVSRTVRIEPMDRTRADLENEGVQIFEHESFGRLVRLLELRYGVTVHYDSLQYGTQCFTMKFTPEESLENVLKVFGRLAGFDYQIVGSEVFIH